MTLYNIGTFETKTDSEMRELISIINQVGLGTMTCDKKIYARQTVDIPWRFPNAKAISIPL